MYHYIIHMPKSLDDITISCCIYAISIMPFFYLIDHNQNCKSLDLFWYDDIPHTLCLLPNSEGRFITIYYSTKKFDIEMHRKIESSCESMMHVIQS